jgi:hypothetical protein
MQRQSRQYSPTTPSTLLDCYSCLCTYKFTIFFVANTPLYWRPQSLLEYFHPCKSVRRVWWSIFTPAKTSAESAGAFSPLQKRPQSLLEHFHPCKNVRRVCWSIFTPAKAPAEFAGAFSPLQKRPQNLLKLFFFLQLKKKAHQKNLLNAAPVFNNKIDALTSKRIVQL